MKKLAVTGILSSGKSTVTKFFERKGCPVVSADAIAHKLLYHNESVINTVKSRFGSKVFKDGKIDRKALADCVFDAPQQIEFLEQLLHPLIRTEIDKFYSTVKSTEAPFFVVEVPLLFEASFDKEFDVTLVVDTPQETCLQRFLEKGGSKEDFLMRVKRQLPTSEKRKKANYVVNNTSSEEALYKQLHEIYQKILP